MKFDFNGQDEITIGFKNNQPIKIRASGQGVFKNENGGLSIDIDDDKLQGIKLIGQERPQMPNVGLDGRAIPKAPMINEATQKERSILDDIAGFGSDLKRTAKAVWDDSIFGAYGTTSNKAEHIKTDIAKAQNNQGLLSSLFSSDEAQKENALKLQKDYDKLAKAYGYDLGAVVENDKIYFGKRGDDGKIYTLDATPSIRNQVGANKGEIIGGLAGGAIGALTRNPGYGRAIAGAVGSALGSGGGAGADYKHRAQTLGDEVDTAGLLKRMGEGAVDDLAAAGALAATLKLGKPSLRLGGKILDNSLIATGFRQIANDNMGGAKKQLSQTLGGDEAVERALNSAKNALDENAYKNFVNADKTYKIPQTPFNTLNKGVDFLNDNVIAPIGKGVKRVLQGENISEKEADMLLSALGDENGAKVILNSVANDPQAFSVAVQKLLKLNNSQKAGLDNAFKDSVNAIESIKNFDTQVKGDFDEVIKTLDSEFSTAGIDLSALNADVKNALKNVLSDNGEISKRINNAIDSGGLKGLQDARAFINLSKNKMADANDALSYQRGLELDNAKEIIDNAVDEALNQFEKINPKIGESARELLNTARSDYKSLKEVTGSDLYKRMTGSMKDTNDLTNALIKSVDNQSGLNLDEILSRMPQANREQIENSLFKNIIDSFTNEGITDFKGAIQTLNKMPFRTQKALNAVEQLNANAGLLNNSGEILSRLKKMSPKQYELSQGIGKKVVGRAEVMVANRLMDKIKSRIPYYGNNRALHNHIANALKNSGDLNALIKNLDDIPPQSTDTLTRKQLEIFKNEIVPEIRQVVKETTEQERKEAINAISVNQNPSIDELNALQKQNENFNIISESKPYQYAEQSFKAEQWINDLSGVLNDEWVANLKSLAIKHPEMFKSEADVFRVIKEIKDNPTHFFKNNNERNALIGKELKNGKFGEVGINKESGQIVHTTQINKEKRVKELNKRQERELGNTSLQSDRSARLSRHSDTSQTMATAKAGSVANDEIIPQNKAKDTKKAEHEASELYFTLAKDAGGGKGYVMLNEKETIKHVIKKYGSTEDHAIKTRERLRKNIETLAGITPIKEFGTNYAEFYHDGNGAVEKLLIEKQGQVAGAFYKDGLGDIDLVWGEVDKSLNGYGLAKISAKHTADFLKFKGATPYEKMANGLNEIIQKGEVVDKNGVKTILYNDKDKIYAVGLSKGWHGKGENEWVITAYEKKNFKNGSGDSKTISAYAEIKEAKTPAPTTDKNIIPQNPEKELNYDENLKNWHKNSHEATKNEDGTPKVFYHGTNAKFDAFDKNLAKTGWVGKGFYFTDDKKYAKTYGKTIMPIYLNLKNPYVAKADSPSGFLSEVKEKFNTDDVENITKILKENGYDGVIYKHWDDEIGTIYTAFEPSQIKHIKNNGAFSESPNIYQSHATIGGGLLGGTLNGVERDENGDVKLNFDDFIKGFFGGAVGAKLATANISKTSPVYKKLIGYANKYPKLAKSDPEFLGDMLRQGKNKELDKIERELK